MLLTSRHLFRPTLLRSCNRLVKSRNMATERSTLPHEDRTAQEPRAGKIHPVILDNVETVNDQIRLFRLKIEDQENGIKFLPGQWLDVFTPSTPKAGGFTITSTPSQALPPTPTPYLELAIQKSPENPPAAWLWQNPSDILGQMLKVRVGGSFTWPPTVEGKVNEGIGNVVFVAGGVGINPLISMVSHIHQTTPVDKVPTIRFLYSTKSLSRILFLDRLEDISSSLKEKMALGVFVTGERNHDQESGFDRRITHQDLTDAVGNGKSTVCYVCGPPAMTDEVVKFVGRIVGSDRVFCEKWW